MTPAEAMVSDQHAVIVGVTAAMVVVWAIIVATLVWQSRLQRPQCTHIITPRPQPQPVPPARPRTAPLPVPAPVLDPDATVVIRTTGPVPRPAWATHDTALLPIYEAPGSDPRAATVRLPRVDGAHK